MSNFDTIKSISDNLQSVLKGVGLHFSREAYEDEAIPASILPHGQIFYRRERFEDSFNLRPEYIDASFTVRVVFSERDPADIMMGMQKWAHAVRDALTVNALNIGNLASSKLVSLVTVEAAEGELIKGTLAATVIECTIRYREVSV